MKKPLYILDGYSLIYRTYYAFVKRPLMNRNGKNRSIVFGFFNTLFSFFEKYKPECFIVALDPKGKTFRHDFYPEYKANRDKAPDDLHEQTPIVEEILTALNIPLARIDKYEADDVIASYAKHCSAEKRECFILSGDKDLMQLVDDYVKILKPEEGDYVVLGDEEVKNEKGVYPNQILDYLSLIGDTADNVPGVTGIGPKTAVTLISEYQTLDNIYQNTDKLKGKMQEKIVNGKEIAYLSKKLITLVDNLELPIKIDEISINEDRHAARAIFLREDITRLAKKCESLTNKSKNQSSLFDNYNEEKQSIVEEEVKPVEKTKFVDGSVETILTEKQLNSWIDKINKAKKFAFDCETTSVNDIVATPIGFSLAIDDKSGAYIPIVADGVDCLKEDIVRAGLKSILENSDNFIIGQNIKYDYKVLKRWGVEFKPSFDTMVAAWLIDSTTQRYGMDYLADKYLNYTTIHYEDIIPKKSKKLLSEIDIAITSNYAGEDAFVTFGLYKIFSTELKKLDLDNIFYDIEMKLLLVLANMELNGIKLDSKKLNNYSKILDNEINEITNSIFSTVGEEFNLNSPKQLQEILYEKLNLTSTKKIKTGFSTDEATLLTLVDKHPVIKSILRYRTLSKLKSTYVDALPLLVNKETKRIHTSFYQVGTATGRLSCKEPNLQNIPIKDEEGRFIRSAFVAGENKLLLSADYSQIELVVLAGLSKDKELSSAFNSGQDIHLKTASLIFNQPMENISASQRRAAKTINFSVLYGMSAYTLASELNNLDETFVTNAMAKEFINLYFSTYSGVKTFFDSILNDAKTNNQVKTLLGHIRKIPNINNSNFVVRSSSEREAVNTVIQGSAATIVKLAMINISEEMKKQNLKSKLLLQIHDELLFEVDKDELELVKNLVKEKMENAYNLGVPLKVSIEVGKNWGEFH